MVDFGGFDTRYFSSMDREYIASDAHAPHHDNHSGHNCDHHHDTNDVGVHASDLGESFGLGPVPNVPAILGKFRAGSKKVELGFMGMGKGGGGGHTAGMYGKLQRQALRETAAANRMDITTHTSVGVFGLAGQDRQGNFSRESKITSLQEIKRAIEFAADVGQGGPVVVHTGEFKRPFSETDWNDKESSKWKGKFESFPDEEERASFYVVDRRTGNLIAEAKKGNSITKPLWMKAQKDDLKKGVKKGDYIDLDGNKAKEVTERVPVFDAKTGQFKTQQLDWDHLKGEAKDLTNDAREFFKKHKKLSKKERDDPNGAWAKSKWWRFRHVGNENEINILPEEAYIMSAIETQVASSRAFALQYTGDYEKNLEDAKKLRADIAERKRVEEGMSAEDLERTKKQHPERTSEALERALRLTNIRIQQAQDVASGQFTQAAENFEKLKHVESARTYALEESYDSYARAGVFAYEKTKQLQREKKLKKPIMVAMENLFPESYGAHPEEIMKILGGSRKRMEEMLVRKKGLSEEQAKKRAAEHLSITLDTGHLNMWRKYWKNDPSKTLKQNDKDFDKWTVDMVKKMAKKNMIGHVHIDDNYGYQDEHLAPGEGNAPIKEMIKAIKENTPDKYRGDMIVEPGADFTTDTGGFKSVMKAWKYFNSPVYGSRSSSIMQAERTWGQVHYNHFGQNQPPYFTFQPYSPSEDWTLWSGVPFE